jgi:predicted enzyme related to lactoylglutathione lyase
VDLAGGKVFVEPTSAPDGLVFAHVLDPQGNHFGLFSPPAAA